MNTLRLTPEDARAAETAAARLLLAGGVAIIPTDTVYGIAAHPDHPAAVARIRVIKGRPQAKPIALLAGDAATVRRFGAVLSPAAERLAAAFWPGALTLVLPCGATDEGFRVPAHAWTRGLLRVTSANLSGAMPALSAAQALRDVGLEADLVIDDGPSPGGAASTVVRATAEGWSILRPGAISAAELGRAAGDVHA